MFHKELVIPHTVLEYIENSVIHTTRSEDIHVSKRTMAKLTLAYRHRHNLKENPDITSYLLGNDHGNASKNHKKESQEN
jgi:hypothetical protein